MMLHFPEYMFGYLISESAVPTYYSDIILARPGRKQATATEDFDFHTSYL